MELMERLVSKEVEEERRMKGVKKVDKMTERLKEDVFVKCT